MGELGTLLHRVVLVRGWASIDAGTHQLPRVDEYATWLYGLMGSFYALRRLRIGLLGFGTERQKRVLKDNDARRPFFWAAHQDDGYAKGSGKQCDDE